MPLDDGRTSDRTEGGRVSGQWVDLREAAELLGTSTEAVRKRATRGSLRSDRHDGRVVVWVDDDRTEGGREAQVNGGALLEAKDETIRLLEEQLRLRAEEIQRRDVIISQLTQANAALAQRVPELKAPQSLEDAPEGAAPVRYRRATGANRAHKRSGGAGGVGSRSEYLSTRVVSCLVEISFRARNLPLALALTHKHPSG